MAAKSTSARRALRVLKCLKGHTLHGLANNEIAKALDDSAVNISRALDVLMDEGWVSRLETGRYALSITALQVAQAHADEVARAMAIIQETTQRIHAGAQIQKETHMNDITCSCSTCEYHTAQDDPRSGELIPGGSGKCVRPEGLCSLIARQGEPLPVSVQDFISEHFEEPGLRSAKARAAQETYDSLRADEYGDEFQDELAAEICQALLSDGEEMVIKLSVAVRNFINREDAAWSRLGEEASPSHAPTPEPALVPEISEERGAEITQMQNSAAIAAQAVMDVEGVLRDLGRLDAALFFATVADSTLVQIFEKIKKEKAYKKIPIRDKDGNVRLSQDLKEFCEAKLGKSYRRLQELSQHMQVLGSDLYESAERIGFRSKDYRALKALPAEEQAVVKQALESESKDEVLAILEDLAAKHQAEREAAKKEKADLTADLEARGKLLEDKAKRLERTEEELYKLKSLPPDEQIVLKLAREEEAIKELNAAQMASLAALNQFLVKIETILETPGISVQTSQYAIGLVQSWCESINTELTNYGIPVDFENIVSPEWMRDAARTDLESGQTTEPGAMGRGW